MQYITGNERGYWFFVQDSNILLDNEKPLYGYAKDFNLIGRAAIPFGVYEQQQAWFVQSMTDEDQDKAFVSLRTQLTQEESLYSLWHRAVELNHFIDTHKFCGKCGSLNLFQSQTFSMRCSNCSKQSFPVICPSIIVAVRKDDSILLARHIRHQSSNLYTILAGFIEMGESQEQAVHREVWEETKIQIDNIRYIGSQAWAFPNSLMLAFLADYAGGDIEVQQDEIVDAKWFNYQEQLPNIAPHGTIARKAIDLTLDLCSKV